MKKEREPETMEEYLFQKARKQVEKKKGFFNHLAAFLAVGFFFAAMNIFTFNEEDTIWFVFPMLPWSIGLIIHYLGTFGFPGTKALSPEWEVKELQKEMQRLRSHIAPGSPQEATEYFDINQRPKAEPVRRNDKPWDERDLV